MLLATAGSDVFSQLDRFKESFLWAAAKGGRVEECESLLQMGTDVNWVSPEGDTPLLAACRNGHVPAALCLLDNGAEVDLAAGDGQTALHFCCRHGNEAIAEALIIRGASVLARDSRGATAFEIPGPRAPTGMLRRLNSIAQRRQDHDHSAGPVSVPGSASTSTHETSISDTRQFRHLNAISGNAISGNATSGNAIAGNPRSGSEESRSGRRISGHQEHPVDTADSAWSLRSAVLHGGRDESPRGEGRTTFPSIAPSVATSHRTLQSGSQRPEEILTRGYTTRVPSERVGPGSIEMSVTSRNLEMHRHAARGGQALRKAGGTGMQLAAISRGESSSDGFQSSDDDNDDNELFEVGTGIRLVGGVYHGSNTRQGSLPGRNRPGRSLFPENMSLMSAGEPVPSASAAIAAAIASAASPVAADPSYSTIPDTPVVSPSRQPVDATPRGGIGSSGSGGGRGSRDNGSGGSSSSSSSSSGGSTGAASHTQAARTSTTPALYGSTSITNATGGGGGAEMTRGAERGAGAGTTRGADRGMGGREELVRRFGSGDVPMASLGSDDSSSGDKGGMTRRGFNNIEERSGANDHVELIRMLWLQEKESRLAAEAKAEAVRDQSARLWNELVRSEKQVLSLEEAVENAHKERDKLKATLRGHGLKGRSLQELEQMEKDFRKALEGVCGERDRIVQGQLAKEEQRLCVVCQENERGVLLLPCRHLCVCRSCSERQELTLCPLCRDNIAESLVVYS